MIFYPVEGGDKAEFLEKADGTLSLFRWPGTAAERAEIPASVNGIPVTEVESLAFAPFHMTGQEYERNFRPPYSFNMFALMNAAKLLREEKDEGGPEEISLPESVSTIGAYAFWHCSRLKSIKIPEKVLRIREGCFGECVSLERITLPATLRFIGLCKTADGGDSAEITPEMLRGMPDVGAFYSCHALKEIVLPETVILLGPQTFNSSGLTRLSLREGTKDILVAENAFDHAAALQWMDHIREDGSVKSRIGLPAARDKILTADRRFGRLSHLPRDFFTKDIGWFDVLARDIFRLDFAARMAVARLRYDEGLSGNDREWYIGVLTDYFAQAPQFMPTAKDDEAYSELFSVLEETGSLTAERVSNLIRTAGREHLSSALMTRMLKVRTESFSGATGFEDLEI